MRTPERDGGEHQTDARRPPRALARHRRVRVPDPAQPEQAAEHPERAVGPGANASTPAGSVVAPLSSAGTSQGRLSPPRISPASPTRRRRPAAPGERPSPGRGKDPPNRGEPRRKEGPH
nr:hypothetical protein GCM10020093_094330 [Planobispora longispora]